MNEGRMRVEGIDDMPTLPRRKPTRSSVRAAATVMLAAVSCGGSPAPPPREVSASPAVSIPITLRDGLPDIDVVVGDQRLALMLDTGAASAIALSPSVLARIAGVTWTGRERRMTNARGDPMKAREFVLPELSMGALSARGVTGTELVYSPDFAPPNRDGYVGRGLLAGRRILVDYGAATLTILSGDLQPVEQAFMARDAVPVEIDADGIVVSATVDGVAARFVIDTGSTHSIVRPRGAPGQASLHTLGVGADRLDGFELVEIDAGPPGVDGMLGRSFFEARRVLVDLAGKRMWLGSASSQATESLHIRVMSGGATELRRSTERRSVTSAQSPPSNATTTR
jgi:predicted aspartyl protease